jgi:hypothetical protein
VPLDDLRADKQPEPCARNRADAVGSIASFEHAAAFAFGYSDAVITYRYPGLVVLHRYADVDVSPVRRIFDRVADQILQDALNASFVVIGGNRLRRSSVAKHMTANERLHLILCSLDGASQVGGAPIQRNSVAVKRMKV